MLQVKVDNGLLDARELHGRLGSKKVFAAWVREFIEKADLIEGKDFFPIQEKSTGGRPLINYSLTVKAAQEICLLQQNDMGKRLRRYLLELDNKVQNHSLMGAKAMAFVHILLNTFQYEEFQLEAEELHKERFISTSPKTRENIHKMFYEHRSDLLGINNVKLKAAIIEEFYKGNIPIVKAKNIRNRIFFLDKYKLIRDATADILISQGVGTIEAINFADTVKEVAEYAGVQIKIKNEDNLFETKTDAISPKQLPKLLSYEMHEELMNGSV